MEQEPFEEPALRASVAGTAATRPRPSRAMRRLALLATLAEQRRNQLHVVLNLLTLWDLNVFFVLDDWRRIHGRRVRGWFEVLTLRSGSWGASRPPRHLPALSDRPLASARSPWPIRCSTPCPTTSGWRARTALAGHRLQHVGEVHAAPAMGLNAVLGPGRGPVSARC
jgi:hypothetical protein